MTAESYARLRGTEPAIWRDAALAWRSWAAAAGRWAADLRAHAARLAAIWTGSAADAVTTHLGGLIRRLNLFRLGCWAADQALSEFAAELARARSLLAGSAHAGVAVATDGTVTGHPPEAVRATTEAVAGAVTVAAEADAVASGRLAAAGHLAAVERLAAIGDGEGSAVNPPPCTATPAEVHRWWQALTAERQRRLLASVPDRIGSLDGIPAAARDLANRLAMDELPPTTPGLAALADRLADDRGPRAYLMELDPAGEGRAVVALGDPDRAAHVLTQVPGMTADLASYGGELARAERIAVRAAQLAPETSTSTIMWLGYDAPDFLNEAATRSRADAGAAGLRRFQDGLRATHLGAPAQQTVLGHSYGSLVVGSAAARPGLAADDVVFAGSPGVGVDSAADLHVPPGRVWSTTSRTDIVQWAAVSPRSLAEDLLLSRAVPGGALAAFGRPEDDLYFGTNPSDPAFGARVFASRPNAGHLGYWDPGSESLDALAAIATGRGDVIPR
jgi:hypothetical protein